MGPVGERRARYGMIALLACGGGAVVFSPGWAPLWVALALVTTAWPLWEAWRAARGTALRGAVAWVMLAVGLGLAAQLGAWDDAAGLGAGGRGILGLPVGAGDPGGADLGLERADAGGRGVGALDGAAGPRLPDPLAGGTGHGPGCRGAGPVAAGLALDVVLRAAGRRRGDELPADAVWGRGGMAGARVYARVRGPDAGRVVEGDAGAGLVGGPLDPGGRDLDGPMALEARGEGGDGAGGDVALVPRPLGGGLGAPGPGAVQPLGRGDAMAGPTGLARRRAGPRRRARGPSRPSPRVPRRPCAASCGGSPIRPGSKRRSIGPARALENFRASADDGSSRRVRSGGRRQAGRRRGVERSPRHAGTALVVLATLAVIAALYFLKAFVVSITLALLLACLLAPVTKFLRRVLPIGPTGSAVVLFLLTVMIGLYAASLTAESLVQAAHTLPIEIERLAGQVSNRVTQTDPRPAVPARGPPRAGDDRPGRRRQPRAGDRHVELRILRPDDLGGMGTDHPGPRPLPARRERDADPQADPLLRRDPRRRAGGEPGAGRPDAAGPRVPGGPDVDQPGPGRGHGAGALGARREVSPSRWGCSRG